MDDAVQEYIDAISPEQRPLFDRVHRLITTTYPDGEVVLSYKMPTYRVGDRSIHVAMWKHGLSFYGWRDDPDTGLLAHHPELKTSNKGTIQVRPSDAEGITDDELVAFFRASLGD